MKKTFTLIALIASMSSLLAQDFMMQGFYWNYPRQTGILRYAQVLNSKVDEMSDAGFTFLWLPPISRAGSDQASVGYDIKDYYDLGEFGGGATRFGTRTDVNNIVNHCRTKGIGVVGDLIFNHRAGGNLEPNPFVEGWIENYTSTKVNAGDQPYPTDRVIFKLPLTDTSSGTYYFKIRSASQHANFYGKPYVVRMWTNKVLPPDDADTTLNFYELEPNGGSNCGEANNTYTLGTRKYCNVDAGGCGIDEFQVELDTSVFNSTGDTLLISLANTGSNLSDMSDHYIYGLWSAHAGADIQSKIIYETYTDFTHMPSGKGPMDKTNFKPDGAPTQLAGDIDAMYFFYDIDHNVVTSQNVLKDYAKWMFDSVGITGMRLDAVKHFPASFMADVLNHLNAGGVNPKMVVGESYDYNPAVLNGWVNSVVSGMTQSAKDSIHVRVFDFALRGALKSACDQFGYDVRNVFNSGCSVSGSGYNVVTFINNHDFRDPGQPVTNNPELAYAYTLTNNQTGLPCIYYLDYFSNIKGKINALMKAHQRYIYGATSVDQLTSFTSSYSSFYNSGFNNTTLAYQLHGAQSGREVVVAINYAGDTLDLYQKINLTNLAVGDTFTNIFGVGQVTQQVNNNQELHIVVPPRSFAVYVQGDLSGDLISLSTDLHDNISVENNFTLYPNPFNNELVLQMDNVKEKVEIEMFDATGRNVFASNFEPQDIIHFTPNLTSSGIYILKVKSGTSVNYQRVIKQ